MDSIVKMAPEERRLAFNQAEERLGLQAGSIEKDFWVCWTLRELAGLPALGEHLTFKGGTSLSKAWKLIDRFSEDIDLVVGRDTLGFGGDASPERAPSNAQRKKRLEGLIAACRSWVQERLQPALAARIAGRLSGPHSVRPDPDDADGQCLLFEYPGAFREAEAGYVRPVVKIELGARSDDWPSASHSFTPYLAEALPDIVPDATVSFRTLAAERTFWEKAMLLHEETYRPADKPRAIRMARHYYDLWCLISRGVADKAAVEEELFKRVAEHRQAFFRCLGWTTTRCDPEPCAFYLPRDRSRPGGRTTRRWRAPCTSALCSRLRMSSRSLGSSRAASTSVHEQTPLSNCDVPVGDP